MYTIENIDDLFCVFKQESLGQRMVSAYKTKEEAAAAVRRYIAKERGITMKTLTVTLTEEQAARAMAALDHHRREVLEDYNDREYADDLRVIYKLIDDAWWKATLEEDKISSTSVSK